MKFLQLIVLIHFLLVCCFVCRYVCENSTELSPEYSPNISDETVESTENDTEAVTAINDILSSSSNISKPEESIVKDDNENDDDEEEDEGVEECKYELSQIVRNFNASPYLPDDYYEVSENMWKEDLYAPIKDLNSTIDNFERLVNYFSKLQSNKDPKDALQYLFSIMSTRLYEAKVSPICFADIIRVVNGIRNFEPWAMKMPDAWANTVPSGLMSGHISSFGEFDQCIKIKSPPVPQSDNQPDRFVYGRYCTAQLRLKVPPLKEYRPEWEDVIKNHRFAATIAEIYNNTGLVKFEMDIVKIVLEGIPILKSNIAHYGICIPNTCSTEDFQQIFNAFLYPITKIPTVIVPELCTDHEEIQDNKLDSFQWFAIYVLSILTTAVTVSTIYHLYLMYYVDREEQLLPSYNDNDITNNNIDKIDEKSDDSKIHLASNLSLKPRTVSKVERTLGQQFILAFSCIQNTKKLLVFDNRLAVIDTLRFFLTIGVYAVQAFNFSMMLTLQMLRNQVDTVPGQLIRQNRYFMARIPGMYIDGFMFTLGLTLYLSQSSRLRKTNGQFSYFSYMFKRWFRLSTALMGTFVFLYLYTLMGDGPIWFINERWVLTPCKKVSSILSSFLYYSNWNPAINDYHASDSFPICNPPTWFLSASTQIYAVLPLIFVPLYRWPKIGMAILLTVFVLSPLMTAFPTWFLGHSTYYDLTDVQSISHNIRKFLNYHTNPLQYGTSVSIGIITGWLLKFRPNLKFIGGRSTEIFLWFLSFAAIYTCYATNNHLWTVEEKRPRWMPLTWIVIVKFVWPSTLGYMVFMTSSGRAKTITKILTLKTLRPIAKLSYSIYLLRVPVIFYRYTTVRYTYGLYYWQTWQNIAIDYLITAFFAFILYILFEGPSIEFIKIFEGDRIWSCLETKPKPNSLPAGDKKANNISTIIEEEKKQNTENNNNQLAQFYIFNGTDSQRL